MRHRRGILLGVTVGAGCGVAMVLARPEGGTAAAAGERHRGVSWKAGGEITGADLDPLVRYHVNWIVQTPFGWQRAIDSPEIALATQGGILWGETDEGLRITAQLARERGIRTLLKPHIWLGRTWRGDIEMAGEEAWQQWFANYRRFILHYARFAQQQSIEALCVGTELRSTLRFEAQWRRIIAEIKEAYQGELTYAANWFAEFEEVPFWDELDFIGVQAYFPLSDKENPTVEELVQSWQEHLPRIERTHKRYNKPVLFTEIGYRSVAASASKPWEWPKRGDGARVDMNAQERCYEAFFRACWDKPWLAGVYWWKWHPKHKRAGGPWNADFTPQNKPAQKIMADWYGLSAGVEAPQGE